MAAVGIQSLQEARSRGSGKKRLDGAFSADFNRTPVDDIVNDLAPLSPETQRGILSRQYDTATLRSIASRLRLNFKVSLQAWQ